MTDLEFVHIAGSGTRDMVLMRDPKPLYTQLEGFIVQKATQTPIKLISGMAQGWDEAIAKVGLRKNIPYIVCLPTHDYGNYYWDKHSHTGKSRIATFNELCAGAEEVIFTEDALGLKWEWKNRGPGIKHSGPNFFLNGEWTHANMARNQVMVDKCTFAVTYNPRKPGKRATDGGTNDFLDRLAAAGKIHFPFPLVMQDKLF